jgi:hypothetical protein
MTAFGLTCLKVHQNVIKKIIQEAWCLSTQVPPRFGSCFRNSKPSLFQPKEKEEVPMPWGMCYRMLGVHGFYCCLFYEQPPNQV